MLMLRGSLAFDIYVIEIECIRKQILRLKNPLMVVMILFQQRNTIFTWGTSWKKPPIHLHPSWSHAFGNNDAGRVGQVCFGLVQLYLVHCVQLLVHLVLGTLCPILDTWYLLHCIQSLVHLVLGTWYTESNASHSLCGTQLGTQLDTC